MRQIERLLVICAVAFVAIASLDSPLGKASNAVRGKRIHINPLSYTPAKESLESNQGKAIVEEQNCLVCHSINSNGGCLAPPFDGIGARRDRQFIVAKISGTPEAVRNFEKAYPYGELFSHPLVGQSNAALVASYLLTLPEPKSGWDIGAHADKTNVNGASDDKGQDDSAKSDGIADKNIPNDSLTSAQKIEAGKLLFKTHGCLSCHSIGNIGGHFAPRLDGISNRHDPSFISNRITSTEFLIDNQSEYLERGSVMPPTNLTPAQIEEITTFLLSLPSAEK